MSRQQQLQPVQKFLHHAVEQRDVMFSLAKIKAIEERGSVGKSEARGESTLFFEAGWLIRATGARGCESFSTDLMGPNRPQGVWAHDLFVQATLPDNKRMSAYRSHSSAIRHGIEATAELGRFFVPYKRPMSQSVTNLFARLQA